MSIKELSNSKETEEEPLCGSHEPTCKLSKSMHNHGTMLRDYDLFMETILEIQLTSILSHFSFHVFIHEKFTLSTNYGRKM